MFSYCCCNIESTEKLFSIVSSFAKLKLTAVRGHLNQTGNLIFIWDKMFLKMKLEKRGLNYYLSIVLIFVLKVIE